MMTRTSNHWVASPVVARLRSFAFLLYSAAVAVALVSPSFAQTPKPRVLKSEALTTVLPSDAVLLTLPPDEQISASNSQSFVCPKTKKSLRVVFAPGTEPALVTVTSSYHLETPDPPMGVYDSYDSCRYTMEITGESGRKVYKEVFDWGPEWAFKRGVKSWIGGWGRNTTIALITLGQEDEKFLLINASSFQSFSNGGAVLRVIDLADLRRKYLLDMWERGQFKVRVDGPRLTITGFYVGNDPMSGAKETTVSLLYNSVRNDILPFGSNALDFAFMAEKADPDHSIESSQVAYSDDWIGQLANPNFCSKTRAAMAARWTAEKLDEAEIEYLPHKESLRFIAATGLDGNGLDGVVIVRQEFSPYVSVFWSKQGCLAGEQKMAKDKVFSTLKYIQFPILGEDLDHAGLPSLPLPLGPGAASATSN